MGKRVGLPRSGTGNNQQRTDSVSEFRAAIFDSPPLLRVELA
jgi:hypothetical protein